MGISEYGSMDIRMGILKYGYWNGIVIHTLYVLCTENE